MERALHLESKALGSDFSPANHFAVRSWENKLMSLKFSFAIYEQSGLDWMTSMKGVIVMLLEQESYSPWAKSGLKPAFINKVLLEHSHTHSFIVCGYSHYKDRVE